VVEIAIFANVFFHEFIGGIEKIVGVGNFRFGGEVGEVMCGDS
jgi:hypothetical protein